MPSKLEHELNKIRGRITDTGKVYTSSIAALKDEITDMQEDIKDLESAEATSESKTVSSQALAKRALSVANSKIGSTGGEVANLHATTGQGIWIYDSEGDKSIAIGGKTSKLNTNIITEFTAATGVTIDGLLLKDGECDGRDVSVDGTKLDTIDTNADVTGSNTPQAHGHASHSNRTRTFFVGAHHKTSGSEHLEGVELDPSSDEYVGYRFMYPKDFVSLTSVQIVWTTVQYDETDKNWVLDVYTYGGTPDTGTWNQHSGTDMANVIVNMAYEAHYIHYFTITSTCFTSMDENDMITIKINRDANNGSDTFTKDILIAGIKVTYIAEE